MITLLLACAPDLAAQHVWDDGSGVDPFADVDEAVKILLTPRGDEVDALVDAQDASTWVELDVDEDGLWDARFKRFHVSTNSGISGSGAVLAQHIESGSWADPGGPDEDAWRVDAVDGEDDDEDPDYALSTWYAYDEATHILTPHPGFWWIRTTSGADFGVVIHSYYDEWGTSARFALTWKAL